MAMTLADLRRLDPKKIGSWPILPKLGVLLITLVLIIAASWWFDWQHQIDSINQEKLKEDGLRKTFLTKKSEAINLPAYQKQLEDIEKQFGALLKQLPEPRARECGLPRVVGERLLELRQLAAVGGHDLEPDAPHLVVRLFAPRDPHGRAAGVSLVRRRIVPADLGVQPGPLGQRDEVTEAVPLLPREVPVVYPQERQNVPKIRAFRDWILQEVGRDVARAAA